jgi:ribonuclease-3
MHPLEAPERLGHCFADAALLRQALTHRSHSQPHNERLEFIGDAVLNCVIAEALFQRLPGQPEGDLSRLRAHLVNQHSLEARARALDLGPHLLLGEGELRSGGAERASILADALEALIGAVFVDAGFEVARAMVLRVFAPVLTRPDVFGGAKDAKTALQEWVQARRKPLPEYRVVEVGGEAHRQQFVVECRVSAFNVLTRGEGFSRRTAEQQAARDALVALGVTETA